LFTNNKVNGPLDWLRYRRNLLREGATVTCFKVHKPRT
jgi:hypothetical protein